MARPVAADMRNLQSMKLIEVVQAISDEASGPSHSVVRLTHSLAEHRVSFSPRWSGVANG
jgi:hypothetical protein